MTLGVDVVVVIDGLVVLLVKNFRSGAAERPDPQSRFPLWAI